MLTKKEVSVKYEEYDSAEELAFDDQELVKIAEAAARSAYAPYSRFSVGAALRLESGIIVRGCNVENAAFPSGICAERAAIAGAVSNHPDDKPIAMAIVAITKNGMTEESISPCGNCRQVLSEEETRSGRQIRLILAGKNQVRIVEGISQLLPLGFGKDNLKLIHP
jgi:cytidine deaminase